MAFGVDRFLRTIRRDHGDGVTVASSATIEGPDDERGVGHFGKASEAAQVGVALEREREGGFRPEDEVDGLIRRDRGGHGFRHHEVILEAVGVPLRVRVEVCLHNAGGETDLIH